MSEIMYESRGAAPWYQSNDLDWELAAAELQWEREGFKVADRGSMTLREQRHYVEGLVARHNDCPVCLRLGHLCDVCHDNAVEDLDRAYETDQIDWETYEDTLDRVHAMARDTHHPGGYKEAN